MNNDWTTIDIADIESISVNLLHAVIDGECFVLTDSAVEVLRDHETTLAIAYSKPRYVSIGIDQGLTYHGDLMSIEYAQVC